MKIFFFYILLLLQFSLPLFASSENAENIKYKSSGRIDFESLLIEGERKKPEMAVVTGNIGEKDEGLIVERSDFLDTMAESFGDEIQ